MNDGLLREAGVATILGGEFEAGLADLARRLSSREPAPANLTTISLDRQRFLVPDREGLPPLGAYAQLVVPDGTKRVGYTEASRGCKHLCRHCPVVPVYRGMFRVVQPEIVLEDIRRQVAAGAQHITFGDPDFFNGPGHAIPIVEALHREWPGLTYDVTIKIEHLLKHRDLIPVLRRTNCAFVTSAVESFEDEILERLAKGHTRAGFLRSARADACRGRAALADLYPVHPWTTRESYRAFLRDIARMDLIAHVAPIQLAIRLLIPEGSLLLDLAEVRERIGPFDPGSLCYPWQNPDPWSTGSVWNSGTDQAGGKESYAARRDLPSDLESCGRGRVARLAAAFTRDDSLSDRALVLLSGAF